MKATLLLILLCICCFALPGCNQRASSGVDGGRTYPELAPGGRLRPDETSHTLGGR